MYNLSTAFKTVICCVEVGHNKVKGGKSFKLKLLESFRVILLSLDVHTGTFKIYSNFVNICLYDIKYYHFMTFVSH